MMKRQKVQNEELMKFINETTYKINQYANELLKEEKTTASIRLLQRVEKLFLQYESPSLADIANLTYNNLACGYKKAGNLRLALRCLETAISYCEKFKEESNIVTTYLNACAILNELGEHKEAKERANKAATLCQSEIIKAKAEPDLRQYAAEKWSLLAIAFYNLGIQEEFLSGQEAALKWYRKAIDAIGNNPNADPDLKTAFEHAKQAAICSVASFNRKFSLKSNALGKPKSKPLIIKAGYKNGQVINSIKSSPRPQTACRGSKKKKCKRTHSDKQLNDLPTIKVLSVETESRQAWPMSPQHRSLCEDRNRKVISTDSPYFIKKILS